MSERPPPLGAAAARLLRRASRAEAATTRTDEENVDLVANAMRDQRGRAARGRLRVAAGVVAALALAAAIALYPRDHDRETARATPDVTVAGQADVVRDGQTAPRQKAAREGDRVVAREDATLRLATGTRLVLDRGAELAIVSTARAQDFELAKGAVRADVAKLHEGERFRVRTADAEVEVRGTSFRVEVGPSCLPDVHTRVVVYEGVVSVKAKTGDVRVSAGETWPTCAPVVNAKAPMPTATAIATALEIAPSAPAPSVPPIATALETPPVPPPVATTLDAPSAPVAASATSAALADANDLFARAAAARKNGDPRKAVALLDQLLHDSPKSPLAQMATVERMRALDGYDHARAVDAAREYIRTWPNGFARGEAEALLALE